MEFRARRPTLRAGHGSELAEHPADGGDFEAGVRRAERGDDHADDAGEEATDFGPRSELCRVGASLAPKRTVLSSRNMLGGFLPIVI